MWWSRNTGKAAPRLEREQGQDDVSLRERLNRLETRLERLELDNAERQVAVLNALEKTMTQLRARERKRERDAEESDEPAGNPIEGRGLAGVARGAGPGNHRVSSITSTSHLSRRFRGGL
jgi:TolA-binding protein